MRNYCLPICLLLTIMSLTGCKQKVQNESGMSPYPPNNEEYLGEAVITGKVLNKDTYPNEKELTLIIPFFNELEDEHVAVIQEDGSFSFSFPVYAKIREVSIRNYVEHLYVRPSDSLYVEIDFKDMFHPKVKGGAEKLNQELLAFTESGYYYMADYGIGYDMKPEEYEREAQKEYNIRKERREEFKVKFKPMPDVEHFTEELLKQDYYCNILNYAVQHMYRTMNDVERYYSILPEIEKLYNTGILSARLFDIIENLQSYISCGIMMKEKKGPSLDKVMSVVGQSSLNQYLYTRTIATSLQAHDTISFHSSRKQIDSIIVAPHLRAQINQLYKNTKSYLENPKSVSDYFLYGKQDENTTLPASMPFMKPIYDILEKHEGKVIYLDFWTTWCPPCLAEMEPLKRVREKFSVDDLVIYSICVGGTKDQWKACLRKYSMENQHIECIYVDDYFDDESYLRVAKQLNIQGYPYYILIDRKGQIVDFGTFVRPSNPKILEKLKEVIENK